MVTDLIASSLSQESIMVESSFVTIGLEILVVGCAVNGSHGMQAYELYYVDIKSNITYLVGVRVHGSQFRGA